MRTLLGWAFYALYDNLIIIRIRTIAIFIPRREKHKREQEELEWYAAGESRDCVRVDKNGNGLPRLWQQQLCQFDRVGMDTAQAITSIYRSPCALIEVFSLQLSILYTGLISYTSPLAVCC